MTGMIKALAVLLLAAVLAVLAVWLVLGAGGWREAALGWSVAALNALAAFLIHRASVRPPGHKFPLRGIFFSILRFFVLLGVIVVSYGWLGDKGFRPFLVAMFAAYFVFLAGEIARLHGRALKGASDHE